MSSAHPYTNDRNGECILTALTQYECSPEAGKVTCWPFERIFRQCGKGPAIEVTNHVVQSDQGLLAVEPKFLNRPPKGKLWKDLRP